MNVGVRSLWTTICLLAITLDIGIGRLASAQEIGLALGTVGPTAAVETLDGKATDLSVYVGKTPILTLGPEDVEGSGEASLSVLGAQVTARLAQAVSTERKRSAIAAENRDRLAAKIAA